MVASALSARYAHRFSSGLATSPQTLSRLQPAPELLLPPARARPPAQDLPKRLGWARRSLGTSVRKAPRVYTTGLGVFRSSSARGAAAVVAAAPGMYQSPRRLCSALLQRDAPGLRRRPDPGLRSQSSPPAAAVPRPASRRLPAAVSAASGAARLWSPTACSMGNGTSRLYSALAKTLNSSAASQHPEYLVSPDPEHLDPIDPTALLEECRVVLRTRPPRFQRDFVDLRPDCPSSHPPVRVMQWNILAQGRPDALGPERLGMC